MVHRAPDDGIGITAVSDFRLGAGCGHCNLTIVRFYQAGDSGFVVRQRLTVIHPISRSRRDGDFCGEDLQTARSDVQAHAVVAAGVGKVVRGYREVISVVTNIFLVFNVITKTYTAWLNIAEIYDFIPNIRLI